MGFVFYVQVFVSSNLQMAMCGSLNPFADITSCFSPSPYYLYKTMLS